MLPPPHTPRVSSVARDPRPLAGDGLAGSEPDVILLPRLSASKGRAGGWAGRGWGFKAEAKSCVAAALAVAADAEEDDPFKALGPRVTAPKDLFTRQIHRRHLRAIKPIGSGQVCCCMHAV